MGKTEVYSWRISPQLKGWLEEQARQSRQSIAALLEELAREGLDARRRAARNQEEEQSRLHRAAARAIGLLSGGDPHRSKNARAALRTRLRSRHGR